MGHSTDIAQFAKIAPYLKDPFVLAGLGLFLFFTTCQCLLKAKILVPLPQDQSSKILGRALNQGLLLALLVIVLGFGFATYKMSGEGIQPGPVNQQAGSNSIIINGSGNRIGGDNNENITGIVLIVLGFAFIAYKAYRMVNQQGGSHSTIVNDDKTSGVDTESKLGRQK